MDGDRRVTEMLYIDVPSQQIPEPTGDCQNCHQRLATEYWVGDGGTLAFARGYYQFWCKRCALSVELSHAKERAQAVSDLERELAALDTG